MSRKSLQPRMQPIDKLPEFLMPGTQASIRWDGVFLKLLPTWARGRKKDRYAYYAYVKAGRAHRVDGLAPVLGRADALQRQLVFFGAADHVEVQVGDDALGRDGCGLDEVIGAEQADLFPGKGDKQDPAL